MFDQMDVLSYRQPFPKRVPNMDFSFSDHEAVMAEFQLTEGNDMNIVFNFITVYFIYIVYIQVNIQWWM